MNFEKVIIVTMKITLEQINQLKEMMISSARKGNPANATIVLDNDKLIAAEESLIVSNHDATAHSERMLVEKVCKDRNNHSTPGLTMVTVCEPCLMCMSSCAWAGYSTIAYIIPAVKYVKKIPWMTDNNKVNKDEIAETFSNPIVYIHLDQYEEEFSKIFEVEMAQFLN